MADRIPTVAERDANLDALQLEVDKWADSEEKRLNNEVSFLQKVLQGRGVREAGTSNLDAVSTLLQSEIDQFIIGT